MSDKLNSNPMAKCPRCWKYGPVNSRCGCRGRDGIKFCARFGALTGAKIKVSDTDEAVTIFDTHGWGTHYYGEDGEIDCCEWQDVLEVVIPKGLKEEIKLVPGVNCCYPNPGNYDDDFGASDIVGEGC